MMRFVDLNRNDDESSFEKVLRLGCGPNFVRNRAEEFEQMIREQGLQFWFRFWLTFCYNNSMSEFEEINKLLPGVINCLLKDIHVNFVQASSDDSINYCWNIIFPKYPPIRRVLDEMYQFMEIGFGCALGEVFFKWLVAKDVSSNLQDPKDYKEYWTIPSQYLNPNFQPGQLEKYLVKQWGNKFAKLLGVSKDQVSWIRKLLVFQGSLESDLDKKALHHYHIQYNQSKAVRKIVEGWKVKLKQMKNALQESDEVKKVEESLTGVKIIKFKPNTNQVDKLPPPPPGKASSVDTSDTSSGSEKEMVPIRHCACCTLSKRLKKCQRCKEENWPQASYYCGVACQSKDWFAKHEKEHCQFLQKSLIETAKLHQFLQTATRPKLLQNPLYVGKKC